MKIEDNLLAMTNCIFKDRANWKFVTVEQKETFFFPINRLLSKKYPELAATINIKWCDKAAALDSWFAFFDGKPYPSWMWQKREKTKKDEDYNILTEIHDIHKKDLSLLKLVAKDSIKEELNYLNKQK